MTDRPTHPNFYLEHAQQQAKTIRSWIHRHSRPTSPDDDDPDGVDFVMGVFDVLDRELARAVKSAEAMEPTAGGHGAQLREDNRRSFNLHQLEQADTTTTAVVRWASSMRWSQGVKPADLDQLELLARKVKENLRHLLAEAREQDLAR